MEQISQDEAGLNPYQKIVQGLEFNAVPVEYQSKVTILEGKKIDDDESIDNKPEELWEQDIDSTGMHLKSEEAKHECTVKSLPLTTIVANVDIFDSLATIQMQQTYVNPETKEGQDPKPIEVQFKFPKEHNTTVSKMSITVAGKTVDAKIKELKAAQQDYDDAIAKGNQATLMKDSVDSELYQIDIGNIYPGQEAVVSLQLIQPMDIKIGAYHFMLPMTYFPRYSDLNSQDQISSSSQTVKSMSKHAAQKISVKYRIKIQSESGISAIAHPANCLVLQQKDKMVEIEKIETSVADLKKDINVYFKTKDMDKPRFFYQKSDKYSGQIALMCQFLAAMNNADDQNAEVQYQASGDGEPLQQSELSSLADEKAYFYFVVDRSGSMQGEKMQLTKAALKDFITALPQHARFSIISFGSNFQYLISEDPIIKTDENLINVFQQIDKFDSNFGGTEILAPLVSIISRQDYDEFGKEIYKKIFLATDGSINNEKETIDYVEKSVGNNCKVFTIGIGDGASRSLVEKLAKKGKGKHCFVEDSSLALLKPKVREMLDISITPAFQDCQLWFINDGKEFNPKDDVTNPRIVKELGDLYRNSFVREFALMSEAEFNSSLDGTFQVGYDPQIGKAYTHKFKKEDFIQLESAPTPVSVEPQEETKEGEQEGATHLFKLAARDYIKKMENRGIDINTQGQIVDISVKYQVLSKLTAFIGVIKQKKSDKLNYTGENEVHDLGAIAPDQASTGGYKLDGDWSMKSKNDQGMQNQAAQLSNITSEEKNLREDLDSQQINVVGQLNLRFAVGGNKYEGIKCTASIYQKISDTHYIIITAAHNFVYYNDEDKRAMTWLDGFFYLQHDGKNNDLAKFRMVAFQNHPDYDCQNFDETYGKDIGLAVVELIVNSVADQSKLDEMNEQLEENPPKAFERLDDSGAEKLIEGDEYGEDTQYHVLIVGYPEEVLRPDESGIEMNSKQKCYSQLAQVYKFQDKSDLEGNIILTEHMVGDQQDGGPIRYYDKELEKWVTIGILIKSMDANDDEDAQFCNEEYTHGLIITEGIFEQFIEDQLNDFVNKYE